MPQLHGVEFDHQTEMAPLAQAILDEWEMRTYVRVGDDLFLQAVALALGARVAAFPAHLVGFIIEDLQRKMIAGAKSAVVTTVRPA